MTMNLLPLWRRLTTVFCVWIAVCEPASGQSCYTCNSTDPSCFGSNPDTTQNCLFGSNPWTDGCFSLLINGTDIFKGCVNARVGPTSYCIRHCIEQMAEFQQEWSQCAKRLVSQKKHRHLLLCMEKGLPENNLQVQGRSSLDEESIEVAFCMCNDGDLCNAHGDKMDVAGSQVKWAEKVPFVPQCTHVAQPLQQRPRVSVQQCQQRKTLLPVPQEMECASGCSRFGAVGWQKFNMTVDV